MHDITRMDEALKSSGVFIKTGPYFSKLKSSINGLANSFLSLYHPSQITFSEEFVDFNITIENPNLFRHWFRPQIIFKHDGVSPFLPLPESQAYPFFEWGLNWCIATYSNVNLILHAAVVEKNGHALIFPAAPGSGKSTLSAGLSAKGWRLLSDEMAIINNKTKEVIPVVRPISLKNESIDVIKNFAPNFVFGSVINDTNKGTVSHVKVPNELELIDKPAKPAWLIFPKYKQGSESSLKMIGKSQSFLKAAENSFNYNVLGEKGFNSLGDLIEECECYDFCYSDLNDAIKIFDNLAEEVSY